MTAAAEPSSLSASRLHAALLEYFSAPGKYQLTLRQPALLFASIREILQIAAGRGQLEAVAPREADRLREAAGFFVRAALLYPGADHYAVFGLAPRAEPLELKERYRLLMRLTHPDFANSATAGWSDDAATRVNRAYEILSSAVLRRAYDEQLAAAARTPRPGEAPRTDHAYAVPPVRRPVPRDWQLNRTAAWSLAFGFGLLLVLFLFPSQETGHLIQKAPVKPSPRAWAREAAAENAASAMATDLRPAGSLAAPPAAASIAAGPAAPIAPAAAPTPAPMIAQAPTPSMPQFIAPPPPPTAQASRTPNAAELAALHRGEVSAALQAAPARAVPLPRAPEPPLAPAARAAEAAAPPFVPAAPAAAPPPMAARTAPAPVAAGAPPPTLEDAQPLLTQLLHQLESGSGEQLLRMLEREGRQAPSAQALSRHYEQIVRGGRPVRLSNVEFRSETRDGVLFVTGRVRLHAGEPTIGSHGERLLVRAEFVSRAGKVLLTGLSGAPD